MNGRHNKDNANSLYILMQMNKGRHDDFIKKQSSKNNQ